MAKLETIKMCIRDRIGAGSTVTCWFENDVSGHLEAGLGCIQENNYWIVKPVTEDNAVAKIIRAGSEDIVYIADAVQISGAIQKGCLLYTSNFSFLFNIFISSCPYGSGP